LLAFNFVRINCSPFAVALLTEQGIQKGVGRSLFWGHKKGPLANLRQGSLLGIFLFCFGFGSFFQFPDSLVQVLNFKLENHFALAQLDSVVILLEYFHPFFNPALALANRLDIVV
jgi:hypothetical protein